jgi:hypothetical protein
MEWKIGNDERNIISLFGSLMELYEIKQISLCRVSALRIKCISFFAEIRMHR